jgi:Spy/CpxP family protein refolding chaperone
MMMKKQLLTITTLTTFACLSIAYIPVAMAKAGPQNNPMRVFNQLNLDDQQKQEMRSIFITTRENNGIFDAEKSAIKQQMEDLMSMPAWDEAMARSIINTQIEQGRSIALNRAKARNQAYNLLDETQKAALIEKASNKANRQSKSAKEGKRKGKKNRKISMKRLSKALELSDSQVLAIQAIDDLTKSQLQSSKGSGEDHRSQRRAISQAPNFDEGAWLTLHDQSLDDVLARKLVNIKAKYDKVAVLSIEQKVKFDTIMKKIKGKRAKAGFVN